MKRPDSLLTRRLWMERGRERERERERDTQTHNEREGERERELGLNLLVVLFKGFSLPLTLRQIVTSLNHNEEKVPVWGRGRRHS